MRVECFNPTYLSTVNEWLVGRELPAIVMTPKMGYMTFYRGTPVACAFLREVEGGYGILDGLCTNPDFPGDQRSVAIDMVVEALMRDAASNGVTALIAWSHDKNTLLRSAKHGFVKFPQTMIIANLKPTSQERL